MQELIRVEVSQLNILSKLLHAVQLEAHDDYGGYGAVFTGHQPPYVVTQL